MKRIFGILIMAIAVTLVAGSVFAVTSVNQSANVTVASSFSAEFANTTDTTFGGTTIPWTAVTPDSNLVAPTGHSGTKSDTAVICKNNGTSNWYLKMRFVDGTGNLTGKVKFYMAQPTMNGVATNGTLGYATPGSGQDWPVIPASDTTVYTCGTSDKINTPNGTFCGINYALNPTGLSQGTAYSGTVYYTITTTP